MLDTATPVSDAPERSAPARRPSTAVAAAVALALIGASAGIAYEGGREVALVAAGAPASTSVATGPSDAQADESPQESAQASAEAASSAVVADAAAAPSPATSSVAAPDTGSAEDEALQQLNALRAASVSTVTLDGRWVAQVASKAVGTVDPQQTAADGTHVFLASDILAEHQQLAVANADADRVLLLVGTDFGKRSTSPDGKPYWLTLVDRHFTSSSDVHAWCATTFADLTPQQQADACAARTLTPPH